MKCLNKIRYSGRGDIAKKPIFGGPKSPIRACQNHGDVFRFWLENLILSKAIGVWSQKLIIVCWNICFSPIIQLSKKYSNIFQFAIFSILRRTLSWWLTRKCVTLQGQIREAKIKFSWILMNSAKNIQPKEPGNAENIATYNFLPISIIMSNLSPKLYKKCKFFSKSQIFLKMFCFWKRQSIQWTPQDILINEN